METKNNLGIWMNNSIANLIDLNLQKDIWSIESKFTSDVKGEASSRGEGLMHNKEQQMAEAYYKEIANEILRYDHVLLFGPTNAKLELHNYLKKDLHFKEIQIDVESADKMTTNEQKSFVKKHFETNV